MLEIFAVRPHIASQDYSCLVELTFALTDGRIENERMPHADTLLTMAIFDEVRRQGGYVYSEGLEKVKA